jgi:hypothetical protein
MQFKPWQLSCFPFKGLFPVKLPALKELLGGVLVPPLEASFLLVGVTMVGGQFCYKIDNEKFATVYMFSAFGVSKLLWSKSRFLKNR